VIVTYGSSDVSVPVTPDADCVPKFFTCTRSSIVSGGLARPFPFPELSPLPSSSTTIDCSPT